MRTALSTEVAAHHTKAYMDSIPRDSNAYVPSHGPWQGDRTKINAAFAYGGARLVVQTVEASPESRSTTS